MTDSDAVFEFNQFPIGQAESVWLKTWIDIMKPKFDKLKNDFSKNNGQVNNIGSLFQESFEVSIFAF